MTNRTDDVEVDIMNFTLDKLTQEISEVIDDDDDDYSDYAPTDTDKDLDNNKLFYDEDYGVAQDDDGFHGEKGYDGSDDNYASNEYNGHEEGHYPVKSNVTEQVDFEAIKKQLISEVMEIYDADKAKFMTAHEADKARILEELQSVKDENAALKKTLK